MTIAQQLEQKGIQKGIQLGWQEGRNEGKLEVARTMLQNGIDHNTAMKITGLTEDDLAQIRHCSPFPGSANTGGAGRHHILVFCLPPASSLPCNVPCYLLSSLSALVAIEINR